MKAISLWQPWATLVAMGAKRIETRHWSLPPALLGQRVAIHAAKTRDHICVCRDLPFSIYIPDPDALPFGAVVATVILERCGEITARSAAELDLRHPRERAFGNYAPGRYAWVLSDARPLEQPVPFRGAQGWFDVPDELVGHTPPQGSLI